VNYVVKRRYAFRLDGIEYSKRPREYIPTEMPEYLIKMKFDLQIKVESEMKYMYYIDKKDFITSF